MILLLRTVTDRKRDPTPRHTHQLAHSHTHTRTLTLTHSHSHTHTHTHSHSHTHTLTPLISAGPSPGGRSFAAAEGGSESGTPALPETTQTGLSGERPGGGGGRGNERVCRPPNRKQNPPTPPPPPSQPVKNTPCSAFEKTRCYTTQTSCLQRITKPETCKHMHKLGLLLHGARIPSQQFKHQV